ncbi:MAG TPA: copper homeostasis protein CutC [Blastocatellia bacterium]|nr:copper homeostasis protein CutC [Blastocatellia bacterium]
MLLEIIACSVSDAVAAEGGGAHRIELISRFDRGGLTPPLDLVRDVVSRVRIPVRVMLRESEDFNVHDEGERARLAAKAREMAATGVDGLVCGFLRDGDIDHELLSRVLGSATDLRVTFHRAFEQLRDPLAAIRQLKRYAQVDRILTSGTGSTLARRIAQLAACERMARPEIAMLAGGGMDATTVRAIRRQTPIREFHIGRGVRRPATVDGAVDAALVREWLRRLET